MIKNNLVLGIDTSNYTTSAALTSAEGEILADLRKPLQVKQGERGLRQSHALFQHLENLPVLLAELLDSPERQSIAAVAVSEKPRPVEGSYMPVFNVGNHFGSVVAKSLQVPFFKFSHQEGHLAAVHNTELSDSKDFLAWHLSGGTCELLSVRGSSAEIIGGSKDISFGQLIDRAGVSLGMPFPCGPALDEKVMGQGAAKGNPLKPIPCQGLYFNLSGIETQVLRLLEQSETEEEGDRDRLLYFLFFRIGECLFKISAQAAQQEKSKGGSPGGILFTGGVSASAYLRRFLWDRLKGEGCKAVFGAAALSSDNGVGISLLGGQKLWH